MRTLCTALLTTVLVLVGSAQSEAQVYLNPNACVFHRDCDDQQMCYRTRCVPAKPCASDPSAICGLDDKPLERGNRSQEPPRRTGLEDRERAAASDNADRTKMADETCGGDRRCRIDRLRRINRARRFVAVLEAEEMARSQVALRALVRNQEETRSRYPWGLDLNISRLSPLGLTAGYAPTSWMRSEISFLYRDGWISQSVDDITWVDGQLDLMFWTAGIVITPVKGALSPFLGAGFTLGVGDFRRNLYEWEFGFDPEIPSEPDPRILVLYHALETSAGLDLLVGPGFHARLGVAYRPLIYNQARYSAASYDEEVRRGLRRWFEEETQIDVIFRLGWAFDF
jgi:hypothetical protein